jgi:hypothetical protein
MSIGKQKPGVHATCHHPNVGTSTGHMKVRNNQCRSTKFSHRKKKERKKERKNFT